MYLRFVFTTSLLLLAPILLYGQQESSATKIGGFLSISGQASIKRVSGQKILVRKQTYLLIGDRIFTGKDSTLHLFLKDGTTIKLGSHTDFTIMDFEFQSGRKSLATFVASNGVFIFSAGKIAEQNPSSFHLHASTATIGIRGSAGDAWTSDGSKGFPNGLKISTLPGHTLLVQSMSGNQVVLEDPLLALEVDEFGSTRIYNKTHSFYQRGFRVKKNIQDRKFDPNFIPSEQKNSVEDKNNSLSANGGLLNQKELFFPQIPIPLEPKELPIPEITPLTIVYSQKRKSRHASPSSTHYRIPTSLEEENRNRSLEIQLQKEQQKSIRTVESWGETLLQVYQKGKRAFEKLFLKK